MKYTIVLCLLHWVKTSLLIKRQTKKNIEENGKKGFWRSSSVSWKINKREFDTGEAQDKGLRQRVKDGPGWVTENRPPKQGRKVRAVPCHIYTEQQTRIIILDNIGNLSNGIAQETCYNSMPIKRDLLYIAYIFELKNCYHREIEKTIFKYKGHRQK